MTTIFKLLLGVCGLSQVEAANLFNVRLDTVKSWSAGRNPTPQGVIDELAALADKIDEVADQSLEKIAEISKKNGKPEEIEIGVAVDRHEAQSLGWPCVGAHEAVIGLTVARGIAEGYQFKIVPRGTTSATAGAADAHGK